MKDFITETTIESLGIPDIEIGELRIWTHNRKYPESKNFWDVNWLSSTFHCRAIGATVWVSGDILHNTEIEEWVSELVKLKENLSDEANLKTMERCLNIRISLETYKRVSFKIDISPDSVFQKHYFEFWLEDKSLPDLIESCRKVLTKFPIKEKR